MLDLLMKRRSIRKYQDRAIEKEVLNQILQGALTSPSSKNRRPWELIVVEDKGTLQRLSESRGVASRPIKGAPLAIVVTAHPETSEIWIEDSAIISTVIQLTAESLGLGSCWIQVRNRFTENNETVDSYVKGILNIPETYEVENIITIGYPDEEKSPHNNETLPYNKIHHNKF